MMMKKKMKMIERVLSSIECSNHVESMVKDRAIIECRARSQSMDSTSTMRTTTAMLLGPLSLLLCLLLGVAGSTVGGSPDVHVRGTGSQGQISDSLDVQGPQTPQWTNEWTMQWTKVDE